MDITFTTTFSEAPAGDTVAVALGEFEAAFDAAVAADDGRTLSLAAGVHATRAQQAIMHNMPTLANVLTIKSADAANPGIFEGIVATGVNKVTFDDVKFKFNFNNATDSLSSKPFQFTSATDLTIKNSIIEGDYPVDWDALSDGYGVGFGLIFYRSTNTIIDGNTFTKWWKAIAFSSESTGGQIINNEITDIRSDGINIGDGTRNIEVANNYIHSFRLNPASGDHVDFIQIIQNVNFISYDALASSFTVGETLTGGTSGATTTILAVEPYTSTTGRLVISDTTGGPFQNNEALTDSATGSATASSASINNRQQSGHHIHDNFLDTAESYTAQLVFTGNLHWSYEQTDATLYLGTIVEDNLAYGNQVNGFNISSHDGAIVRRNTIVYRSQPPAGQGSPNPPKITVAPKNATATDNVAPAYDLTANPNDGSWTVSNNLVMQWAGPNAAGNYFRDEFLTSTMNPADIRDWRYDPAGVVATGTAGYRGILLDTTPATPKAIFDCHQTAASDGLGFTFTDYTYGPDGKFTTANGATWSWNFGDGSALSTAETPTHTYAAGGTYTVTMTVTKGGVDYVATYDIPVRGNGVAVWDGTTGFAEQTFYGTASNLTGSDAGAVSDGSGGFWIDVIAASSPKSSIASADIAPFLGSTSFDLSMTIATDANNASQSGWFIYHNAVVRASFASGKIKFEFQDGAGWNIVLETTGTFSDALDHTILVSLAGGTVTLTVDDVVQDTAAMTAVNVATNTWQFGGFSTGGIPAKIKAFSLLENSSDFSVDA